jgi:hypothetical protein
MTQTLLTPITESPSGQYGWALTLPGSLGPIVKVFQNVKGTWGGCGEWYADTLAELGEASRLAIDYGAGWTLDEVDTAALAAASIRAPAFPSPGRPGGGFAPVRPCSASSGPVSPSPTGLPNDQLAPLT